MSYKVPVGTVCALVVLRPPTFDALSEALTAGRVPVVVLNACQSGAVGKELEAAVATRLLREGAAAVIGMA